MARSRDSGRGWRFAGIVSPDVARTFDMVPVFWGHVGLEKRELHANTGLFIERTPRGMSDVYDPDVGILDEVMDTVRISRDKAAA